MGGKYLKEQVKIRDSVSEEGMSKLRSDILSDTSDLEGSLVSASSWYVCVCMHASVFKCRVVYVVMMCILFLYVFMYVYDVYLYK